MDIATIIGVLVCIALVASAIVLGGDVGSYINIPSMLIVVGGAFAATLAAFPLTRFLQLPKILKKTLFTKPSDPVQLINQMVELAEIARWMRERLG